MLPSYHLYLICLLVLQTVQSLGTHFALIVLAVTREDRTTVS